MILLFFGCLHLSFIIHSRNNNNCQCQNKTDNLKFFTAAVDDDSICTHFHFFFFFLHFREQQQQQPQQLSTVSSFAELKLIFPPRWRRAAFCVACSMACAARSANQRLPAQKSSSRQTSRRRSSRVTFKWKR